MPIEIRAALHRIQDSIVLSHLFCTVPEGLGRPERRYPKDKLMAYASENYAWIDSAYMILHKATTVEAKHTINLINAINKDGLPEALKHA